MDELVALNDLPTHILNDIREQIDAELARRSTPDLPAPRAEDRIAPPTPGLTWQ